MVMDGVRTARPHQKTNPPFHPPTCSPSSESPENTNMKTDPEESLGYDNATNRPTHRCEHCGRSANELEAGKWLSRINPGDVPARWVCARHHKVACSASPENEQYLWMQLEDARREREEARKRLEEVIKGLHEIKHYAHMNGASLIGLKIFHLIYPENETSAGTDASAPRS